MDYLIVLGGDGTILASVRALGDRQVPVIGVNIGKLGFLAEFSIPQLQEHFERIVADPNLISRRTMLQCRIDGPGRSESFSTLAVNEVALTAGPPFRMIEVSISIGEEHLALCTGDGLVVATPTGSTAYNLSAGGPILMSTLAAAVITPLAAHSLSFRPVVVDLARDIRLRCRESHARPAPDHRDHGCWGAAVVAVDGQVTSPVHAEDTITITRAQPCFHLVHHPQESQWRLLNRKLNWGALPNYAHDRPR